MSIRFNPLHGAFTLDPENRDNAFSTQTLKERKQARTDTVFNLMRLDSQLEALEKVLDEASLIFEELNRVVTETNKQLVQDLRTKKDI